MGKKEVVGRILDEKVENDYFRLWKWLFIMFDLSSKPDAMAPFFQFEAKILLDEKNSRYYYKVYLEPSKEPRPSILFSLDKKFLL